MKTFSLIITLLFSHIIYGQTWDQKYERTAYESRTSTTAYFTTTITITSFHLPKLYDQMFEKFSEKDGIFKMEIGEKQNTIVVYHKEEIVFETFKELLADFPANLTYEMSEPEPFQF